MTTTLQQPQTTLASSTPRSARLDFRLGKQQKQLIEQAAISRGQSISDFAISNLIRDAQKVINKANTTQLSMRDRDIFLDMLESDSQPNQALKTAAQRYKKNHG